MDDFKAALAELFWLLCGAIGFAGCIFGVCAMVGMPL
jgi:hypothetical protein